MAEPIRILNLFTILDRGGAETMVMNYYRHIDKTKVQFDFLVHRPERGAYEDEIESLGGKVYRMRPIRPGSFHKYEKELDIFFKEHPEYKIIHSHCSELGYYAFKVGKKNNVPVRICHAHSAPTLKNASFISKLKNIFRIYFKNSIRPLTTDMFVCSTVAGDWLFGEQNQSRFVMVNNAIDSQKYIPNDNIRTNIRQQYSLHDKFVIGHVGRFVTAKNHTFMIDAFNEVKKKNDSALLMLIGSYDSALGRAMQKKAEDLGIQDSVLFVGEVPNVNEVLQGFDVFFFPSLFEGLPVSVVEAQAAGLQCVISDTITKQCIVTNNVEALSLEEPLSVWADTLLKYSKGYQHMDTSQAIINSHFDIAENAKWLQEFYIDEYKNNVK